MSKSRPITPKELADIKASADAALSWLYGNYGLAGSFFKSLRRKGRTPEQESALRLQWAIQYDPVRDLRGSPYPEVIADAVKRNDHTFFINLGRLLASKTKGWESLSRPQHPSLAVFLVTHWAEAKDGLEPLYSLTQNSLVVVCESTLKLKTDSLTWSAVAKWRQRLKLKPFKRAKLEATWTGKGWKFEPVDRRAKRGASVYGKRR